jgi:hypothetical protein
MIHSEIFAAALADQRGAKATFQGRPRIFPMNHLEFGSSIGYNKPVD